MVKKKDKQVKKKDKYNKHIGKFPVNSRITVDYTGKKPSVKFAYPSKDTESTYTSIACVLPAMIIIIILAFSMNIGDWDGGSLNEINSESCNTSVDTWIGKFTNKTYFKGLKAECLINDKIYNMTFTFVSGSKILWFYETQPHFYQNNREFQMENLIRIIGVIILVMLFFPLCRLFGWIYKSTKKGNEVFPEINKVLTDDRYSAVFKKCPKSNQLELPLFKNIYMDYEATGEFGKYLKRVEIREHPFNELINKKSIYRKRRKTIKKKNIWLWKATFFFSQQPKKGQLEIKWT